MIRSCHPVWAVLVAATLTGCAAATGLTPRLPEAPPAATALVDERVPHTHASPGAIAHVMPDGSVMPGATDQAATVSGEGAAVAAGGLADAPAVSFRREVVPVLKRHCASCHTTGMDGAKHLDMFDEKGEPRFENIKEAIGWILLEVQTGKMPKGDPVGLSQAEFMTLDLWGAAQTPDN